MKALILAAFAFPSLAHARNVVVKVDSMSYPSPARVHLSNVQSELARQAVIACGGQVTDVSGITAIEIKVEEGLGDALVGAVVLEKGQPAIMLNYPILKAQAVAVCRK